MTTGTPIEIDRVASLTGIRSAVHDHGNQSRLISFALPSVCLPWHRVDLIEQNRNARLLDSISLARPIPLSLSRSRSQLKLICCCCRCHFCFHYSLPLSLSLSSPLIGTGGEREGTNGQTGSSSAFYRYPRHCLVLPGCRRSCNTAAFLPFPLSLPGRAHAFLHRLCLVQI